MVRVNYLSIIYVSYFKYFSVLVRSTCFFVVSPYDTDSQKLEKKDYFIHRYENRFSTVTTNLSTRPHDFDDPLHTRISIRRPRFNKMFPGVTGARACTLNSNS